MKNKRHLAALVSRFSVLTIFLSFLIPSAVSAADSLALWADGLDKPEIQQKVLALIFPNQIGQVSTAKQDKASGRLLFPRSGGWVRLQGDVAYSSSSVQGGSYLVVSSVLYRTPERGPYNTTTYLLRNTTDRPTPLSGGYAVHESVQEVKLPKLGKSFLVLVDADESNRQWSAFLLALGTTDSPRTVWNSPASARRFHFGFDSLGGSAEELVLRVTKGKDVQYTAYRWNGSRFESDNTVFQSRFEALPDGVWQFGSGQ